MPDLPFIEMSLCLFRPHQGAIRGFFSLMSACYGMLSSSLVSQLEMTASQESNLLVGHSVLE
jgi:hypothetical protein